MVPEAGQRFGPYEILARLGGGGMGLVFRAWDQRLHREVAVKLLHDNYVIPGMRERFLQEARAASGLNHPNICTVFDIGEQEGEPYLVMELLEGETLRDRIARGALPVEEIVRYSAEIADALSVAHSKGIVHRDIKPANIFLVKMPDGRRQAKVLDFGLAKIDLAAGGGWESRTLDLTLHGATVGTLAYMSPEQARGESLDGRSDLFSLGIVMYEMATRRVPFKGTTSAVVFRELFDHDPEPVRDWNETIPRAVERIIDKLLAKDRRARFQTASELRDFLLNIGGKLSKGKWLGKPASAVPLVRAPDPVARQRRLKPKSNGGNRSHDDAPETKERADKGPSSGNIFLRALRLQERDRGGPSVNVAKPAAIPVTSPVTSEPLPQADEVPAQSDSSVAAAMARASRRAADEALGAQAASGSESAQTLPEDGFSEELSEHAVYARKRTRKIAMAAALLLVVAGALFLMLRGGLFRPLVLGPKDRLLLTVIQNKTADKTLDGTVMQGLEIALRQSDSFNVLGGEAYRAGLRQIGAEGGEIATTVSGQRVAQKAGATAYLYGEISGATAPYTISVEVLKADSNDKVASLEQPVESREQIPTAVAALASAVRLELGERKLHRGGTPPQQPATDNVDALQAYATGELAMQSGRSNDALAAYQQAVALDPAFVQAQMRLAWLYREEKAEVAASNAAKVAQSAAEHLGEKTKLMAQSCYEMNVSGDYDAALKTIRTYVARFPFDVDGMTALARILRLQGYLPEALLAAQQGYDEDPYSSAAYTEAEFALIGLDRSAGVRQLRNHTERIGLGRTMNAEVAAYLAGPGAEADYGSTPQAPPSQEAAAPASVQPTFAAFSSQARALDDAGKMKAGLELWRSSAARAGEDPALFSTQASMLAQAALDHALVEDCNLALKMVEEARSLPKGPEASFNAGMAAGLCGDETYVEKTLAELKQDFPHNTELAYNHLPELEAAGAIGINEPLKALQALSTIKTHGESALADYLRSLAYLASGQKPLAIDDLRTILSHPGMAFLACGDISPMAEVELARAYAADAEKADSREAYASFIKLWQGADTDQPRLIEATAKVR
jgi:serine/threonine protein kinase/tetratricopeptide (TPR) repeat protein